MANRGELAVKLHHKRCNCCQSVVLAFEDVLQMDKVSVFKAAEGFAGGMGAGRGNCGAISGAVMVAGLYNSDGNIDDPKTKQITGDFASKIYWEFTDRVGTAICDEIRGVKGAARIISCDECIKIGVEVAEKTLGL